MGYTSFAGATREAIVGEILEVQHLTEHGAISHVLAHRTVGNVVWAVREVRSVATGEVLDTFIGCDLLAKHGDDWSYKSMDELVGPYYYSCPLAYLDMAPEKNGEWRAKVRAHHAGNASQRATLKSLRLGDTVALVGTSRPTRVRIAILKPRLCGYGEDHRLYRIPTGKLGEIIARNADQTQGTAFPD